MKRSEKILAAGALVAMLASSAIAVAWPGGGIGYPNTMIYDQWQPRSTAYVRILGAGGAATGQLTIDGSAPNGSRLRGPLQSDDDIDTTNSLHVWQHAGATLTLGDNTLRVGTSASGATITGPANQDVTVGQQGTSKFVIHFPTGDGAGSNADRVTIDSDKVKITTSPGTSTGVLVGADSGALDLKANAAGGGEIKLLSGGNLTIGASGSQFSTLLNGSGSLTPGSIAAGGQFTQGVTVTGVAVGDACFVGTPAAGGGPDITASCFASASGTATVKLQNGNSAAQTGTTGTYNCWCIH